MIISLIEIITLIKYFLLSWFIVRFEPIQWMIELLPNNLIKYLIITMTTCMKCVNFWLVLILTQDLLSALSMSFIGMLYEKTLGKWEKKISFK